MLLVRSSVLIRVQIVKRGRWGKERRVGRWLGVCSSLLPTAMTKPMSKSTVERGRFISIYSLQSIMKGTPSKEELRLGTWRQELQQKPWKNTAYWLAHFSFLYNTGSPAQGRHCLQEARPSHISH